MSSYGLTFNGKHSYKDLGLIMKSVDRSLLPAVKRQQVDIPFLDGKTDLQREPVFDNRTVTVTLAYHAGDLYNMQMKKRAMAAWLMGESKLIFDDEPDRYYEAKVFDAIATSQSFRRLEVEAVFECRPFALNNAEMRVFTITDQNQQFSITVAGNIKTCGTIILTNTGQTTIQEICIRRERTKT